MIRLSDVQSAAVRIANRIRKTPLVELDGTAFALTDKIWLKLEHLQHTGTFKPRGAFNRIIRAAEIGELPRAGVIAASGGNAGLAVAYAAAQLGIPAQVFLPTTAPRVKEIKLRKLGADVIQVGDIYNDAYQAAVKRAEDTGALFCHAYDQREVCAGQGTLGLELLEQVDNVDTILVAIGGGGLLAGIATAVEDRARVIGVEPEEAPTLNAALAAGRPVDVAVSGVAADSLGATRIGDIGFGVAVRTGVESVLVSEEAIIESRRILWDQCRLAVEHGAAAAFAGLISGAYKPKARERIAVVICGANTNPADLAN
jgi:threonine dehydratase